MKRIVLLLLAVFGSYSSAKAQVNGAIQGFCDMGAVSAITQGLPSTNKLMGVIPSCTIKVYLTGTQTLATIYSNSTGTPLANPFTATALGSVAPGQWTFYAANSSLYDVVASGGIPPNVYIQPVTLLVGAGAGGGGSSPPQYCVQFALNNFGAFGCDPNITINPILHSLNIAGSGTGSVGLGDSTTGHFIYQFPGLGTTNWNWDWPVSAAPTNATGCLTGITGGTGTLTTTGSWYGCGTVIQAAQQAGSDIGAQVNNSIAACTSQCVVHIQSGIYSFTTQIVIPMNLYGQLKISGDPGAILNWMGSSTTDAIVTKPLFIGASNLIIEGFQLRNAGAGIGNGLHLYPTSGVTVRDMLIDNFENGDGIRVEGVNSLSIYGNLITNNQNGIEMLSTFCTGTAPNYTCSPGSLTGTLQAANAVRIHDNTINDQFQWNIKLDDSPGNGDSGALAVSIYDNVLELGGRSGSTYGALYSGKSTGLVIGPANYFEGSPREIVLGLLGAGNYYGTVGASVISNYFTTLGETPYNVELMNADRTTISGNAEQGGGGVSSSNCFINVGGGETNTVLIPNSIVQGQTVGNRLCIGGIPAQTFTGANSYILFNTNYKASLAYGEFQITAAASDTQPSANVAPNSACYATAANNASQATAQSLIAQVYVQPGVGQFTIFHPTGHAGLFYDVWCTGLLN